MRSANPSQSTDWIGALPANHREAQPLGQKMDPPVFDTVFIFKMLILQSLYKLSDDEIGFQS